MFDFSAYFTSVTAALKGEYPTLPTIDVYPKIRKALKAPAILLEVGDLTPIEDPGTEELAMSFRPEAHVVFGQAPTKAGGKPSLEALTLAADVARFLYQTGYFGQDTGKAKDFRVEPDVFRPDLAAYAPWLVTWTHEIRLGASVWDGTGVIPSDIYAGLSPLIGTGHEADYTEVTHG